MMAQDRAQIENLIAGDMKNTLKDGTTKFMVRSVRFLKPDIAIVITTHQIIGQKSPDGTPMPAIDVMMTCIMENQNGTWMCAAAHPMMPLKPPVKL